MKKLLDDLDAFVNMSAEEAKSVCRMGQGKECCAFLVVSSSGFQCCRMVHLMSAGIFHRLEAGTMNAQGRGGWEGCAWKDELTGESSEG